MTALDNLIKEISRLPGLGPKSAQRIAYALIRTDKEYNRTLGENIATIQDKVFQCSVCGSFTEKDPCDYCTDPNRDSSLLCIVEQPQDVMTIAASGDYNGLYHVLGGAISPIDGIGPAELTFAQLVVRINEGNFREVIIATNPNEEGDTTALYIRQLLKGRPEIKLTRLASGLPIGGDLEYADRTTLRRSFSGRINF